MFILKNNYIVYILNSLTINITDMHLKSEYMIFFLMLQLLKWKIQHAEDFGLCV